MYAVDTSSMNGVPDQIPVEVSIDHLSLLVDAAEEDAGGYFYQRLIETSEASGFQTTTHKAAAHYKLGIKLMVPGTDNVVLLQAGPRRANAAPLRIEFNPASWASSDFHRFNDVLEGLFSLSHIDPSSPGYEYLVRYARVSRFDVAADFHGLPCGEPLFSHVATRKAHIYSNSAGAQTLYLGASDKCVSAPCRVYDKSEESGKVDGPPVTRVEFIVKPKKCVLKSIAEYTVPFSRLAIHHPKNVSDSYVANRWPLLRDSAHMRGVDTLIGSCSAADADLLEAIVCGDESLTLWEPEVIRSLFKDAAMKLLYMPSGESLAA